MDDTTAALVGDDRITAYGLMLEANRRLERLFERSLREHHDLSQVEFEALLRLGRSNGAQMSMSELAQQMVLSSGGITRLIDRLGESALVERRQCPEDRRIQWAHLTKAGERRLADALATHLVDLEAHFSALISSDEQAVMNRVLDRLRSGCTEPRVTR